MPTRGVLLLAIRATARPRRESIQLGETNTIPRLPVARRSRPGRVVFVGFFAARSGPSRPGRSDRLHRVRLLARLPNPRLPRGLERGGVPASAPPGALLRGLLHRVVPTPRVESVSNRAIERRRPDVAREARPEAPRPATGGARSRSGGGRRPRGRGRRTIATTFAGVANGANAALTATHAKRRKLTLTLGSVDGRDRLRGGFADPRRGTRARGARVRRAGLGYERQRARSGEARSRRASRRAAPFGARRAEASTRARTRAGGADLRPTRGPTARARRRRGRPRRLRGGGRGRGAPGRDPGAERGGYRRVPRAQRGEGVERASRGRRERGRPARGAVRVVVQRVFHPPTPPRARRAGAPSEPRGGTTIPRARTRRGAPSRPPGHSTPSVKLYCSPIASKKRSLSYALRRRVEGRIRVLPPR